MTTWQPSKPRTAADPTNWPYQLPGALCWVAAEELKLSNNHKNTLLCVIYSYLC